MVKMTALSRPEYKNKWIAFKADRRTVIAAGTNLRVVLQRSRALGHEDPILMRVPKDNAGYVL